jgi:hypothetical protein
MGRQLVLVREAKLASLLAGAGGDRLEASGVLAADGGFYVIFDNAPTSPASRPPCRRRPAPA